MSEGDFLSPRRCFVTPIPQINEAAALLAGAADALLAGNQTLARALIRQADMPVVHAYASRIMGKVDIDIHRYRPVAGPAPADPTTTKNTKRMPAPSVIADIYRRDGYRCRFCGCRVVLKEARSAMARLVPDAITWDKTDKTRHAAFFALTATLDHLVPHARGGDNTPENLLTTCQPCNFGKGNWLIEEIGLLDPRSRPPVVESWDGLRRISANRTNVAAPIPVRAGQMAPAGDVCSIPATKSKQPDEGLSHEEWLAKLDQIRPGVSSRLLEFIDECEDLQVSWSLKKVFRIRIKCGDEKLDIMGIERTGDIEIPWWIGEHKARFRSFTEIIASGIPDAEAYETPKMWRVRKFGRRLHATELLENLASVRIALEKLRQDLDTG